MERHGDYFVVEGIVAIDRLLGLPEWHIRHLALLPRVRDRLADRIPAELTDRVVVADAEDLRSVVGFDLHRGALASVDRRPSAELTPLLAAGPGCLLVAAESVNDHENLGALYRNAAAFGATAVVLDDRCADPFYRRSVRVSQGNVLAVPTVRVPAGEALVPWLAGAGVRTIALSPSADRPLTAIGADQLVAAPVAVVVGAEGPGLSASALAAADERIAIEIANGVDSLNVATAAAIALHHLRSLRRP